MQRTLILAFHPDLNRSRANRAMLDAAAAVDGVEVVDMQHLYPTGHIDTDAEVHRLLQADRIVLQFPVQWYAAPALLKQWLDDVFTRMYYLRYTDEGQHLEGTPLMVAATAGNLAEAYGPEGVNLYPLAALLRPLEATAHRCKLPYATPFLAYRANKLDAAEQQALATAYRAHLLAWMHHPAAGCA